MIDIAIVELGAAAVDDSTGLPKIEGRMALGGDADDAEAFGELDVFSSLGVIALPAAADDTGHAEGLVLRGGPGVDAVLIGARDARTAALAGNLRAGDTVLHSTGPARAAQVQCKEAKRQVVLATKTSDGKSAAVVLDGANDKFQIALLGYMIEVSEANGIVLATKGGAASIQIKDDVIVLLGKVVLGGRTPAPLPFVYGTPGPGQIAALGVFPGL